MKKRSESLTIAVDGYSSCGKSTFAKRIAEALGYVYIDSGAMYRAFTLYCLDEDIIHGGTIDEHRLKESLEKVNIDFVNEEAHGSFQVRLNGKIVEDRIRTMEVSQYVSPVSRIGEVREKMVGLQRSMGKKGGVVMDGRDIGTVVFPDADLKIFMTADRHIRAQRRFHELQEKGVKADLDEVEQNISERDHIDETRAISPLKKAGDAVVLDNSHMTVDEQMDWFMDLFKERRSENKH